MDRNEELSFARDKRNFVHLLSIEEYLKRYNYFQ